MSSSDKKYNFNGKVALVTGSSSGIGASIAVQFAQYGASVTITGRDSVTLAKVAEEVKKVSGKEPLQLLGDLQSDATLPQRLVSETVNKFGQLDFLVNNAGTSTAGGKFENANLMQEFDRLIKVNLRSVVELTQLAIPHLEKTKGNVLNISSVAAIKPYGVAYSASKAALDMVTKCSAQELGPKGIRVNSINPGPVRTGIGRSLGMPNMFDDLAEMFKGFSVLNRLPEAVEIAHLASFLVSDDAANITGSIMVSEGGTLVK